MTNKEKVIQLSRQNDILREEKQQLDKQIVKNSIEIANIRAQIIRENYHLIGKKVKVTTEAGNELYAYVKGVSVNDQLDPVPIFDRRTANGSELSYVEYELID